MKCRAVVAPLALRAEDDESALAESHLLARRELGQVVLAVGGEEQVAPGFSTRDSSSIQKNCRGSAR
jgi:hypothetical protein